MSNITGTVNWGIIGCGDVCEIKSGPAFNKVPHSKLVAVMRRNPDKAKDFAQRHGVPDFYTDALDLIANKEVNAIYIATPPSSHELYLEMALKAGKPVYVEKPVSINAASVTRMMAMEEKYNGKVSVAHYRRGLPLFIKLKQWIQESAIGKVKLILLRTLQPSTSKIIIQTDNNWRINPEISGGGLFHDLSPHQLDILYWIFGAPQQVEVMAANQGKQYRAADHTFVQLAFTDDIYFDGVWNFNIAATATEDSCKIIGDKGHISFSFFRNSILELVNEEGSQALELESPVNIQQPHIHQVVKYFRGESVNPCTLQEALVTMQVMEKAVVQ